MRQGEQEERERERGKRVREKERHSTTSTGRKSPTKLRRCISPFVTPTPGRVQHLDVDVDGDQGCSKDVHDIRVGAEKFKASCVKKCARSKVSPESKSYVVTEILENNS